MQGWKVYDSNPKTIKCPLVCLPPVSGTADIFFKQILGLSAKGYRVIAVSSTTRSLELQTCEKNIAVLSLEAATLRKAVSVNQQIFTHFIS